MCGWDSRGLCPIGNRYATCTMGFTVTSKLGWLRANWSNWIPWLNYQYIHHLKGLRCSQQLHWIHHFPLPPPPPPPESQLVMWQVTKTPHTQPCCLVCGTIERESVKNRPILFLQCCNITFWLFCRHHEPSIFGT